MPADGRWDLTRRLTGYGHPVVFYNWIINKIAVNHNYVYCKAVLYYK